MNIMEPRSAPKPKVLHILNELCLSGAELMLASAADQLGAQDSMIVSTGAQIGDFAGQLRAAGYTVLHCPFSKSPRHFVAMARLIRDGDFEIVHVHPERARLWYILASLLLGKQVVTTIHAEFPFSGALRWRKAIGRRLAVRLGATFVACSRRVARNENERFKVLPQVILNWAAPGRSRLAGPCNRSDIRRTLGIPETNFVTISIANEALVKNVAGLVRAITRTPARHIHLHLGTASPALREHASRLTDNRIRFIGQVEDIARYLGAADAFVCSSFAEGGPLVLIEAALAALPCISTNVGIVEEFTAFAGVRLVEPDPGSIAAGIEALMAVPEAQRQKWGQELAEFAGSRFTPAVGGHQYASLYRGLAARIVQHP